MVYLNALNFGTPFIFAPKFSCTPKKGSLVHLLIFEHQHLFPFYYVSKLHKFSIRINFIHWLFYQNNLKLGNTLYGYPSYPRDTKHHYI